MARSLLAAHVDGLTAPASTALPSDEQQVIAGIRGGDGQTFDALYTAHSGGLWRFAYALVGDAAVAEDVIQDVFVGLWERRAEWRVTHGVRAWLYGAVRHRAGKYRRHEAVVARAGPILAAHIGTGASERSDAAVDRREITEAVSRAMAELPPARREVAMLRWVHQLDYAEIAAVLGISPGAARVQGFRAQRVLAPALRGLIGD